MVAPRGRTGPGQEAGTIQSFNPTAPVGIYRVRLSGGFSPCQVKMMLQPRCNYFY